jgi:hypothetical protein
MIDWSFDWAQFLTMLIVPAGMFVAGLTVYARHMRDERKWAEEKRRHQTPAE